MNSTELLKEARYVLDQGDATRALRLARRTASINSGSIEYDLNVAGILIDAGNDFGKSHLIREGIFLLENHRDSASKKYRLSVTYFLANGYLNLGQRERGKSPGTKPSLSRAVELFDECLEMHPHPDAHINLASAFLSQGRYIEALDELEEVLSKNPNHHVAISMRGAAYWQIHSWMKPHHGLLESAYLDYEKALGLAKNEPVFLRNYRSKFDHLQQLTPKPEPKLKKPSKIQSWIWEQRLALNPCPLCFIETPDALDVFTLQSLLKGGQRRPSVDETLDLINTIHQNFGTARWCLMQGMGIVRIRKQEQIIIQPGSQKTRNDLRVGLIISALSSFFRILNQISFALNSYFHLGHKPRKVTLDSVWHQNGKSGNIPRQRSDLHPAIRRQATPALSALYRFALSFEHGSGRYADLRDIRNKIEHHLIVVASEDKPSRYFVRKTYGELVSDTLKMGRLARAAIWYFSATVWYVEYQRLKKAQRDGVVITQGTNPVKRI